MERPFQQDFFLNGEGDSYFERNKHAYVEALSDSWNKEVATYLENGNSVLEIGCSGAWRLGAIEHFATGHCQFSGVDPSSEAVEMGRLTFPHFDIRVGTASETGFSTPFDVVILGFCLYLCDRSKIFQISHHVDNLLTDGGVLAIHDFDPPFPMKLRYRDSQLWSYKMNYSSIFLANPSYYLLTKKSRAMDLGPVLHDTKPGDRSALWILKKNSSIAYLEET